MKSKIALLTILFLLFPMFSGCWSRNEIETLAIIGGMGVDKVSFEGKDKFLLTVNIVRPALAGGAQGGGGGGQGQPVYWRVTALGDTMADAERNLNLRIPRRVFYGHLRFVIISEELARDGLRDVIDYLHRHMRIRLRLLVLLTEGRATDKLIKFSELETTMAEQVELIATLAGSRVSKVNIRDLAEVTDAIITPGLDPVLGKIVVAESAPTESGGGPIEIFRFPGGGVVKGDTLVGWLDEVETKGYLLAIGQAQQGAIPVNMTKAHSTTDVSINLTRSSGRIEVKPQGDKFIANIKIGAEGDLSEYHNLDEIATNEGIIELEELFKEQIEKYILKAVDKAQELNADIFGFGSELHKSDPDLWSQVEKDWYTIFPEIEVKVKVTAHIRRTGMIANPYVPR